jgi:SAM-dependent methyltransferase
MHEQSDGPDSFFQRLGGFDRRLRGVIEKLKAELEKPSRRNARQVDFLCAEIDRLTREYLLFLTALNTARIAHEAAAGSPDEVMNVKRAWGIVGAQTNLFRLEINRWATVRGLVQEQRQARRQPIYPPQAKLAKTTYTQMGASDDVFHWIHAMLNPSEQSEAARDHDCFPDIALANSEFHEHLHAAYRVILAQRRTDPVRFLDVGCGGGLKVLTAFRYFPQSDGFDFDPAYVAAAHDLLAKDDGLNCHVFEQDALTFDGYGNYDVIYFYRPISEERLLIQMEQAIAAQARPGTVLVAPYVSFPARHEALGCGHIGGAVYVAGMSQKQANSLRIKAERMGPYIVKPDDAPLSSVWDPLLDVSRANGYDIPNRYEKPRY